MHAVRLDAVADPDVVGRRPVRLCYAFGQLAAPARTEQRNLLRFRSRRSFARCRNHIRPEVQDLHDVVAFACVGHADDHRLLRKVQPSARSQRVHVGRDYVLEFRCRVLEETGELVDRCFPGLRFGNVRLDTFGHVHQHDRVTVDVRFRGNGAGIRIGSRCRLLCRRGHGIQQHGENAPT